MRNVQTSGKRSSTVLQAPKNVRAKICKTMMVIQSSSSRPVIKPKAQFAIVPTQPIKSFTAHTASSRQHDQEPTTPQHLSTSINHPSQYLNTSASILNTSQKQAFNNSIPPPPPTIPPPPPSQAPPINYHSKPMMPMNQSLLLTSLMNASLNASSLNNSNIANNTGLVLDDVTQAYGYYQEILNQSNLFTLFDAKSAKRQPPPPYPGTKVIQLFHCLNLIRVSLINMLNNSYQV